MLAVFTLAIFLSAGLLFLVQPMVAKMLTPLLGGTPAVWNTSMLFFQAVLLGGYLYAHLLGKLRTPKAQVVVHAVLMLAALVTLPIALPRGWAPPTESSPVFWVVASLAVAVGAPFFVLCTTGPLLQRWFAFTDHPSAKDPYFLYAASNAGSLLGLLAYPLLELAIGLRAQGRAWSIGYIAFVAAALACGVVLLRGRGAPAAPATSTRAQRRHGGAPAEVKPEPALPLTPIGWRTRGLWVLLAFVPSSLMLGVTLHFSSDLGAIPLLWVIPLSIYLFTFIVSFSSRNWMPPVSASKVLPLPVFAVALISTINEERPIWVAILLHLSILFFAAMLCHGRLAASRPHASRLTEFYLWIAVGGVLGGLFNALVAPFIFKVVLEYPLAVLLALLLRTPWDGERDPVGRSARLSRVFDVALPVLMLASFYGVWTGVEMIGEALRDAPPEQRGLVFFLKFPAALIPLAFMLFSVRRRLRFALTYVVAVLLVQARLASDDILMHVERTFFGVHRVTRDPQNLWHRLAHGTTRHGIQYFHPELVRTPTMYYHPTGPLGDVFMEFISEPWFDRVGIIGLGSGGIAAYAQPGDYYTYYEIDPAVIRIAEDERYFTYLKDARNRGAQIDTVLGDARQTIAKAPDGQFDLLICDAFSSDAIPTHLLTREAVEMYLKKLTPTGLLVFHVSNRYLFLPPVLGAAARDLGILSYICDETPPPGGYPPAQFGKEPGTWVVLARQDAHLAGLARAESDMRWVARRPLPSFRAWTDDYSNILKVFYW